MAQSVKNLPAMQENWVQSLGQEDPLEKGMTTHSSILVWRTPWTEEPGGAKSQTRLSNFHFSLSLTAVSVVAAHGLSSCGSQVLEDRLSSCGTQT